MKKNNILIVLLFILLLVIFLKLVLNCYVSNDNGFFVNLTTEIIGVIITYFAIDKVIEKNEKNIRIKYQKIAFRILYNPLRNYISMWLHIGFENEDKAKEALGKTNLNDLFLSDEFIDSIKDKDFNDLYNNMTVQNVFDSRKLKDVVILSKNDFTENLNQIISKYAIYYDPETLLLLEHFAYKSHLYEIFKIWEVFKDGNQSKWFQSKELKKQYFQQHFIKLFKLVNMYNRFVDKKDALNNNSFLSFKKFDDIDVEY